MGERAEHPSVFPWGKTGATLKEPAEEGLVLVAHLTRDTFHGDLLRFEKTFCILDTEVLDVVDECRACRHLETPLQASFGSPRRLYDACDGARLAVVFLQPFLAQPDD